MQAYKVPVFYPVCPGGFTSRSQRTSSWSRISIVINAKRKGVSKELREVQKLKGGPATAPTSAPPPPPAAPVASPPPQPSAAVSSSSSPPSPTATSTSLSTSFTTTVPASSSSNPNPGPKSSGSGLFDNLLIRIFGSVVAIMAVITVFYSIVFYGASNVVYVFKDQLAAITKKDFIPYSERRRLEQEVLAKLEADQAERPRLREGGGSEVAASQVEGGTGPGGSMEAADIGLAGDDTRSSTELLNMLPSRGKK